MDSITLINIFSIIFILSPIYITYISLISCFLISGCRDGGNVGTGATQGDCGANMVCQATGECTGN